MSETSIECMMSSASDKLNARINETKVLDHRGTKGTAREQAFVEVLSEYLPKTVSFSSGELIDLDGNRSPQIDIVIQRDSTPVFYGKENTIIPCESAVAVIEIKSRINNQVITECFDNMKKIKSLVKKAIVGHRGAQPVYYGWGKTWKCWPIRYYVYAFESDIKTETLANHLFNLNNAEPLEKRIDTVCVHEKELFTNCKCKISTNRSVLVDYVCDEPKPETRFVRGVTKDTLLIFLTLLHDKFWSMSACPSASPILYPYILHTLQKNVIFHSVEKISLKTTINHSRSSNNLVINTEILKNET